MLKRVVMVAGEASGDLHGSGVVSALRQRVPGVEILGIGGDAMQREGMVLLHHIAGLSFMGFTEVVRNLRTILRVESDLVSLLDDKRPDVVVLIDFPGFNLRIARRAHERKIPVLYYISPQVWAWNRGRVKKMRHLVDRMKVVFPFEVGVYRDEGIDVEFVGHPIVEKIGTSCSRAEFFARHDIAENSQVLGLFPGSRLQEIERILPLMIEAAEELRKDRILAVAVGVAPNIGSITIRKYTGERSNVILVDHGTYDLMAYADAAIVTSGTATLETGWFGTPMAVVYRTSASTFFIGRLLVDVPYIGLVNIVAGKKIVPEFIQRDLTLENLTRSVSRMLDDGEFAARMREELGAIRTLLGGPGASGRVADAIIALGARA